MKFEEQPWWSISLANTGNFKLPSPRMVYFRPTFRCWVDQAVFSDSFSHGRVWFQWSHMKPWHCVYQYKVWNHLYLKVIEWSVISFCRTRVEKEKLIVADCPTRNDDKSHGFFRDFIKYLSIILKKLRRCSCRRILPSRIGMFRTPMTWRNIMVKTRLNTMFTLLVPPFPVQFFINHREMCLTRCSSHHFSCTLHVRLNIGLVLFGSFNRFNFGLQYR